MRVHAKVRVRVLGVGMGPQHVTGEVAEALGTVADHLRAHRRGETCDDADCPLAHSEPDSGVS